MASSSTEQAVTVKELNASIVQVAEQSETKPVLPPPRLQILQKVIEDIAFQTNIFALNAVMEAARAGTAVLIASVMAAVERGTQVTAQTAQQLQDTGVNTAKVTESFYKIEQAPTEQTGAIERIKEGLSQISSVIQANAATAEENSATSKEMSAQTVTLREEVGTFRLNSGSEGYSKEHVSMLATSKERPELLRSGSMSPGKY